MGGLKAPGGAWGPPWVSMDTQESVGRTMAPGTQSGPESVQLQQFFEENPILQAPGARTPKNILKTT